MHPDTLIKRIIKKSHIYFIFRIADWISFPKSFWPLRLTYFSFVLMNTSIIELAIFAILCLLAKRGCITLWIAYPLAFLIAFQRATTCAPFTTGRYGWFWPGKRQQMFWFWKFPLVVSFYAFFNSAYLKYIDNDLMCECAHLHGRFYFLHIPSRHARSPV